MAEIQRQFIGNREYSVSLLPAKRGLRLFVKWGKMLGPTLAKLSDPKLRKADTTSDAFATTLAGLFANLEEGPLDSALDEILCTVSESDRPLTPERYNVEFAGNLVGLCMVVAFALETQFGDFWKAFATMGEAEAAKQAQVSPSQPKSK